MRDNPKHRSRAKLLYPALSPEAAALMRRRVTLILGFVPLPEMTQAETDWVFHQSQRAADDQ
ncbi:hypothetical protein [Urbifossiella limnaea]|uniref:Uncharacterized protein n=1 Tax=Urbifossiella limnaea TaxID=2528023 RepID=A0A517Y1J3_9BACT|nr:hypothetical protein [Urbifossiella limnaea]QDU23620.1 hypothetical protein ETAA1_56240 [Urbifossiella limnaea]